MIDSIETRFKNLTKAIDDINRKKAINDERRKTVEEDIATLLKELKAEGCETPEKANETIKQLSESLINFIMTSEGELAKISAQVKC